MLAVMATIETEGMRMALGTVSGETCSAFSPVDLVRQLLDRKRGQCGCRMPCRFIFTNLGD